MVMPGGVLKFFAPMLGFVHRCVAVPPARCLRGPLAGRSTTART